MDLITGLLAILLEYFGQDRCTCADGGTCIHCIASRALDEAEASLPSQFAAANVASGPALRRRFRTPHQNLATTPEFAGATRYVVANVHSDDPHYSPENCDFALVCLFPELAEVLLAYRDGLAGLSAAVRQRFPSSASYSHELELFPPCSVDYLPLPIVDASGTDDDAMRTAVDCAIDQDQVVALPGDFDPSRYPISDLAARTDTDHCEISSDGATFATYVGDTRLFTTTIPWVEIEAVLSHTPDSPDASQ